MALLLFTVIRRKAKKIFSKGNACKLKTSTSRDGLPPKRHSFSASHACFLCQEVLALMSEDTAGTCPGESERNESENSNSIARPP